MATRIGYTLSDPETFQINSIEDIERVLKENNIIPIYEKHLNQLNTCINMFQVMEKNRTFGEIFCDHAAGKRNKINGKRLLKQLENVRDEMLQGIEIYTRLHAQKEEVKNLFNNLNLTKFELKENDREIHGMSPVKEIAKAGLFAGVTAVVGAAGGAAGGAAIAVIIVHYGLLAISLGTLTITTAVSGGIGGAVGLVVLGAVGIAIWAIYKFAQYKGKERGLKYQQVKELYDALDDDKLFGKIQTDHQKLEVIFNVIDKHLNSQDTTFELAKNYFIKSKRKAMNRLANNPRMNDEMRLEMAEMQATTDCETYLRCEFKYTNNEEIEQCLNEIKRDVANNQRNDTDGNVPIQPEGAEEVDRENENLNEMNEDM